MFRTWVVAITAKGGKPAAIIGTATNWEAPAVTMRHMRAISPSESPAWCASPPQTVAYTKTEGTRGKLPVIPCLNGRTSRLALSEVGVLAGVEVLTGRGENVDHLGILGKPGLVL